MELTPQQTQALELGEVISVVVNGTPCILLRKDSYLAQVADADLKPSDFLAASIEVLNQFDDNPDQYLEYLND